MAAGVNICTPPGGNRGSIAVDLVVVELPEPEPEAVRDAEEPELVTDPEEASDLDPEPLAVVC